MFRVPIKVSFERLQTSEIEYFTGKLVPCCCRLTKPFFPTSARDRREKKLTHLLPKGLLLQYYYAPPPFNQPISVASM